MTTQQHHKLKAIYFDLGNTLIYYSQPWPESFYRFANPLCGFLHNHGMEFDDQAFQKMLMEDIIMHEPKEKDDYREDPAGKVLTNILTGMGFNHFGPDFIHQALRVMFSISETMWQPEQDALPVIRELKKQGYLVGIISNAGDDENVQNLIDLGSIRPYLDFIVSSAGFGYGKPNPNIFQYALDELRVSPNQALMVGDTLRADILGANRIGMKSVWITRRARGVDQPITNPEMVPWKTIKTLDEILDLAE
jgi:HAD superfamily hydrolase (TIGR01662 family)